MTDQFWTILEYAGVFSMLLYLFLEIKQKPSMWIVGIISSIIYVAVFAVSRIYADMAFNIYYAAMSIYGFFMWRRNRSAQTNQDKQQIDFYHITKIQAAAITAASVVIYSLIYIVLSRLTDSPVPHIDAFTTTLSIVATWMLAKKIIEHWALWIIVNFVSIYLYQIRGLYPTMLLYTLYTGIAFYGYYNWLRKGILIKESK